MWFAFWLWLAGEHEWAEAMSQTVWAGEQELVLVRAETWWAGRVTGAGAEDLFGGRAV